MKPGFSRRRDAPRGRASRRRPPPRRILKVAVGLLIVIRLRLVAVGEDDADRPRMSRRGASTDVLGGGNSRGRRFCGRTRLPRQAFTQARSVVSAGPEVYKSG